MWDKNRADIRREFIWILLFEVYFIIHELKSRESRDTFQPRVQQYITASSYNMMHRVYNSTVPDEIDTRIRSVVKKYFLRRVFEVPSVFFAYFSILQYLISHGKYAETYWNQIKYPK